MTGMTTDHARITGPGDLFSLEGKVAIVTGASSGLGARWAPMLAAAGERESLSRRAREKELRDVVRGIPDALVLAGDLDDDDHRRLVVATTLDRFGRIDVLVNNAGTAASARPLETTLPEFRALIETDLTSLFAFDAIGRYTHGRCRPRLDHQHHVARRRALPRPLPTRGVQRSQGRRRRPHPVTRSRVGTQRDPGQRCRARVLPTRLSGFLQDPDQVDWISSHTALRRPPRLDELDGTIVFLAGDASSYITGQHLIVDGGWSVY